MQHIALVTALSAGFGSGGRALYLNWRNSRKVIVLELDGKGGYRDSIVRKERAVMWSYVAFVAIAIALSVVFVENV